MTDAAVLLNIVELVTRNVGRLFLVVWTVRCSSRTSTISNDVTDRLMTCVGVCRVQAENTVDWLKQNVSRHNGDGGMHLPFVDLNDIFIAFEGRTQPKLTDEELILLECRLRGGDLRALADHLL